MGKIRKRHLRTNRYNPIQSTENSSDASAGENSHGPCQVQGELLALKNEPKSNAGLRNLKEKLGSTASEEHALGLNTLAALAIDSNNCADLMDEDLITKAIAFLSDSNALVRLAAAGALRNLSASSDDDMINQLVQCDIMSGLVDLYAHYHEHWTPQQPDNLSLQSAEKDPHAHSFIHATHLLLNLCECSEEALDMFNKAGLIEKLLNCMDPTVFGFHIAQVVADCLLCVSENNVNVSHVLLPMADKILIMIARTPQSHTEGLFYLTLGGLLLNIGYCANIQTILKAISMNLETDHVCQTNQFVHSSQGGVGENMAAGAATNGLGSPLSLQELENMLAAQQLALEMLSNISSPEDGDWEECDESIDGFSDEENMDLSESQDASTNLPPEVDEGIKHFNLVDKVLKKIPYLEDSTCTALKNLRHGETILRRISCLRTRSLQCFQNLLSVLDTEDLGGPALLYTTWANLGALTFQQNCTDTTLLEAATGAMRAVMGKLNQSKSTELNRLSQNDLQIMFNAGLSCSVDSVRSNLARMVGSLGCLIVNINEAEALVKEPAFPVLKAIVDFLLQLSSQENQVWVMAEALDALIDMFSDDKTDHLAHNTHLVDRMKGLQPIFKEKHQQKKKKLGDHRALVMTVRDNLASFTKYKENRVAKVNKFKS
ncbi:HEAT repeat-containing protein 3 isoform X2 [Oratosquilla oratoria]|uniref:HEAT repeat-containing protein 3 isoform X2 n=1 Tax=Oratosquilla oratoria TaxID=337810 RepID=UPI003F7782C2